MEFKDYYKIMEINKDASQGEIKRAYRKLARKYHPDVSKEADAESRFKVLGEAYEVLKDPEKRAAYDQLGSNWKSGQEFNPPPDWNANYEFSGGDFASGGASAFSDFFESLFGRQNRGTYSGSQRQGSNFRSQGEDHHAKVMIDIEDAFHGATRAFTLHAPKLNSHGHLVTQDRTLKVQIPKGISQGQQIRLSGQGTPGTGGGEKGDLYLEVEFKPHSFYRAEGKNLYLDLPLTPWEAALGAKVKVPTPAGIIDLKIAADSGAGNKLRLKGRGIPGKPAGDLYVILQISLPSGNTQKAQKFYRKMEQELAFNPRARLGV